MNRRRSIAKKDPLRQEYSILQNMRFIMKGTFRYQKVLLVMALQTFAGANIGWRMHYAQIEIMMRRIHKVLLMDYEHLESAKVKEACQRVAALDTIAECEIYRQFNTLVDGTIQETVTHGELVKLDSHALSLVCRA